MSFEIDPDDLYINATLSDTQSPLVYWSYKQKSGTLTVTEARARARGIFTAGAIAESEAAIVRGLRSVKPPSKGFGKQATQQTDVFIGQALLMVRNFRPSLPEGLQVVYGHYTQQPLLVIEESWYGTKMQLQPEQAIGHAMHLMGAAEAAQTDAFLYNFLQERTGTPPHEAQPLITDFGLFRQRNELEDLLRSD